MIVPASELKALMRKAVVEGLNESAEHVRKEAVRRTPLDEGSLRESLEVVEADVNDPELASGVVSDSPYAVPQHENMHYVHPKGGEAKFLENAALATVRDVEKIMADAVSRRMKGA